MVAQPLRAARTALFLNRLEHVGHVNRVVAGGGHHVRAFEIRLPLVLAAEAEKSRPEAELRPFRYDLAPAAADDRAEHRTGHLTHFVLRCLAGLRGPVTKEHV